MISRTGMRLKVKCVSITPSGKLQEY